MPSAHLRVLGEPAADQDAAEGILDAVFAALADPVRRSILAQLDGQELLVSEIARQFDISLQAVSKHIQVLVRAGLVRQERTGRISRCSLVAGPIYEASVWLNRYSKYWQDQFDLLAAALQDVEAPRSGISARRRRKSRAARCLPKSKFAKGE
jgi:DNA-binding transcriptional ArsR family regulator